LLSFFYRLDSEQIIAFSNGASGNIQYNPGLGTYTPTTGWNDVIVERSAGGVSRRAYMPFLTANLPENYFYDKAYFKWFANVAQIPPFSNVINIFAGQFIGVTLDGNAAEWNGGTDLNINIKPYGENVWIDLNSGGVDFLSILSTTAATDIKLVDNSTSRTSRWGFNTANNKCQLKILYHEMKKADGSGQNGYDF